MGAFEILNIVAKEEEELIVYASSFLFTDNGELFHKILAHFNFNLILFFHICTNLYSMPSRSAMISDAVFIASRRRDASLCDTSAEAEVPFLIPSDT